MPILRQTRSRQRLTSLTNNHNKHTLGLECRTADNLQCVITDEAVQSSSLGARIAEEVTYNTVRVLFGVERRCELLAMKGGKIDWELAHKGNLSDLRGRDSDSHRQQANSQTTTNKTGSNTAATPCLCPE